MSVAPTFGATEQEILNERIGRLLKLTRGSVKINAAFVQIDNPVGYIECTFHIVGDNDASHSKAPLQPANQSINAVRDHGIETRCGLIVQYTGGPANDGASETDAFFHSAA